VSLSVLEQQVRDLPLELQKNIEMYALFVINQYRESSLTKSKKSSVSASLDKLTGVISESEVTTMEAIRLQRLSEKLGN
jgi:hypothetical protein